MAVTTAATAAPPRQSKNKAQASWQRDLLAGARLWGGCGYRYSRGRVGLLLAPGSADGQMLDQTLVPGIEQLEVIGVSLDQIRVVIVKVAGIAFAATAVVITPVSE